MNYLTDESSDDGLCLFVCVVRVLREISKGVTDEELSFKSSKCHTTIRYVGQESFSQATSDGRGMKRRAASFSFTRTCKGVAQQNGNLKEDDSGVFMILHSYDHCIILNTTAAFTTYCVILCSAFL